MKNIGQRKLDMNCHIAKQISEHYEREISNTDVFDAIEHQLCTESADRPALGKGVQP
jgi:hypothetical protein